MAFFVKKTKPKCVQGISCGGTCIAANKSCNVSVHGQGKLLSAFLHQADHLGENVVSWKVGKVVGQAIAQTAIAAGVPHEVASIVSESVIQAGAATAIHATKKTRETGEFDAKDTASHFVQQLAAAALGKISHTGMEGLLEMQAMEGMVATLAPLVAGKGAGILTAAKMKSSGMDRRIVEYVMERSKADLNRIRSLFSRSNPVTNSELEFEELDKEGVQFLFDLTMATYALAIAVDRESKKRPQKN